MFSLSVTTGYAIKVFMCLEAGDCLSRHISDGELRWRAESLLALIAASQMLTVPDRAYAGTDMVKSLF